MPEEACKSPSVVEPANRIVDGRSKTWFKPGNSGNPEGRPKGFGKRIRELTNDGEMLIQHCLSVLADDKAGRKDKAEAVRFLAEYGFGKPIQSQDIKMDVTQWVEQLKPYLDPSKREELARVLSRIADGQS